jgi:hypothetical protein
MIGKNDNQDEATFKVADRRKFNADGSLREGVTIEPNAPKQEKPPIEIEEAARPATGSADERVAAEAEDENEIPGADDPASFVNFLSTIATNAAAARGAVPHPATRKRSRDL